MSRAEWHRHKACRAYNLLRARGLRPSTISFLCTSRADLARSAVAAELLCLIADRAQGESRREQGSPARV